MPKEKSSKLDQYAATLLIMDDEKKSLDEMITWLKEEGVSVAKSTLSEFLERERQRRAQESLLSSIVSGSEQCRRVESEFAKNPAPELETLVKLHRVLILNLTTLGKAGGSATCDTSLLKLADQMTNTVITAISAKTKAELEAKKLSLQERRVSLLEKKAAAYDKAKSVSESKMTAEEKAAEFRRIFGMAG